MSGPFGAFVYGHASTDVEHAIMTRRPAALERVHYRHGAAPLRLRSIGVGPNKDIADRAA